MTFDQIRTSIETFFVNNITDAPLRFEGQDYPNQDVPFIGVMINNLNRNNETLGNTQHIDGNVRVRVFTQRGDGQKAVYDLCDSVISQLDNQNISGINLLAADVPTLLETEDTYYAMEFVTPYFI